MPLTHAQAGALGSALVRAIKMAHVAGRLAPPGHDKIDAVSQIVLFKLADSACRVSTLAEKTHCDVSTVSRQVSALADLGLVEKLRDPADGRAFVASLTSSGRESIASAVRQRGAFLADVLADWDDADADQLAHLLNRFADDVDRHLHPDPVPIKDTVPTKDTSPAHPAAHAADIVIEVSA